MERVQKNGKCLDIILSLEMWWCTSHTHSALILMSCFQKVLLSLDQTI